MGIVEVIRAVTPLDLASEEQKRNSQKHRVQKRLRSESWCRTDQHPPDREISPNRRKRPNGGGGTRKTKKKGGGEQLWEGPNIEIEGKESARDAH